jgi:hypothetical protein
MTKLGLRPFSFVPSVLACALSVGCGASRDVEVSGEVSPPDGVTADGPVVVQFYDVSGEEETLVDVITLEHAGDFSKDVAVEGDALRIVAILDRDDDAACTDGEPWAELSTEILEDDTAKAVLELAEHATCPAAAPSAE